MTADNFPELARYRRVIFEDFEFSTAPGARPVPVCCTATDWRTGQTESRWLGGERPSPINLTADDLYVSYYVPAELCCRLVLGWPLPTNVLDFCVEYKRLKNGKGEGMGRNLVAALLSHGIDAAPFVNKRDMQMLGARGGPYTDGERTALLAYNRQDVDALIKLFPRMLPRIDSPRALLRGRYMLEESKIQHNGIPIDVEGLQTLADNWEPLKGALIRDTDRSYGVWQGTTFKEARWEALVKARGWLWPPREDGRPSLHRDTFKRMAERYPEVEPIRSLRGLLSQFRHFELPIGPDGRARCNSDPFHRDRGEDYDESDSAHALETITGRHARKAKDFIFSWPKWCRGLVCPPPGRALIHLDFSQQEYLITGTLSGDEGIVADYRQGDAYVGLGKSLGLIPPDGNERTHPAERKLCKVIVLAIGYGMGALKLADKINRPVTVALDYLRRHREKYRRFWEWSDATVEYARIHRRLWTKYGWSCWFGPGTTDNTLRNWRVQATAGEVLRVAVCALGTAGFQIDATVHDSVLLEVAARWAEEAALAAERIMVAASVAVLGEPLRVSCQIVRPGERLLEAGSPTATWERLWRLLAGLPSEQLFAQK
jgi:hypothetical protein